MTEFDQEAYRINDDYYSWSIKSYEAIRKRLGLNVKVHPDDELLGKGHIFLFNHFARFETVIPPYIIYQATGAHTRSVADHELFEINDNLSGFLRGVGAMPNNQKGLLAFLAAEILRGRKVVIFPEGGMIKDRQVVAESGEYGIFSPSANGLRKHHRGAAVLSLHLDIFKQRILELHKRGDTSRIGRWVKALDLKDEQQLLSRAQEPTLIVPATITFYPIRVEENFLSKAVSVFAKNISEKGMEEMLVEGNLIFSDTDMDIHLNTPIKVQKKWHWWEKKLLNKYFQKVSSLNDLFGLRDIAHTWAEKLLERCINKETTQIRDKYMPALYTGTTVNLSHVASTIITCLMDRNQVKIPISDFHKTLYLCLKQLQVTDHIHRHRSLNWPDHYRGLLVGESAELDRFLTSCKNAGLVGKTPRSYRFLDKLSQDYKFHEVRLENPVLVYANEVAPLTVVKSIVENALDNIGKATEQEFALYLFDDEKLAFEWNRKHYNKKRYAKINAQETATQDAAPYFLQPKKSKRKGVLLIHGFLASPAELRDFAQILYDQEYTVMGVRITGHGTSPWDLKERSWEEWLASVRRSYQILSAFVDEIVIVGFSAGGVLGLLLAAEQPDKLHGVASVSAPVSYRNKTLIFVPIMHGINKIADWLPSFDGVMPFRENESEHPEINYRNIPVHSLYQLRQMTSGLEKKLPLIQTPTIVLQGDNDPVVDPESARTIFNGIENENKSLHWVSSDRHGILNENIGNTHKYLLEFINKVEAIDGKHNRHCPPVAPQIKPVFKIFEETASRVPDNPCVDFMGQVATYHEIGDLINKAAMGLQNMDVQKGDRIGICLPNCPYYIIAYFAILKIGATVVNFNPLYTEKEIHYQIKDSGVSVMFALDLKSIFPKVETALNCDYNLKSIILCSLSEALPTFKSILFNTFKRSEVADISNDLRIIPYSQLIEQGNNPISVAINPTEDIAVIQYTGGTTGVPKGAMLTHANIVANTEQVCLWMGETDPDGERILCAIPFFHVFAMTAAMNLGIASGAELILHPRFNLNDVLKTIVERKITLFPAVPTIFNAINSHKKLDQFDLSSIRFCISGGAPLPSAVKQNFEKISACTLVEGYGLTEASPVISCNPPDAENKVDSIGLPLPWTQVEIRDLKNKKKKLKQGERGELAVRGPQVMAGYWNNPKATTDTIHKGWLLTGDVGHIDEEGYIFLTDRLKDIIICSGFNVYPRIIEDAFYLHPDVDEVIVIGIPDEYRGEKPKAYVKKTLGAEITEESLMEFVESHLNPVECPAEIEFRDELPKTMIGKLSKKELVAEVQANMRENSDG